MHPRKRRLPTTFPVHRMIRNDDNDIDEQQQQQQQDDAAAVLPDCKDQARPHIHEDRHIVAAATIPTKRQAPVHNSVIPVARPTVDDQKKQYLNVNAHPNQLEQHHDVPLEGLAEIDHMLPLAHAIPISRFVDTDSTGITNSIDNDNPATVNSSNSNHENAINISKHNHIDSSQQTHPTVTTKQQQQQQHTHSNTHTNIRGFLLSRVAAAIIMLLAVLLLSAIVIAVVCGMGNCETTGTSSHSYGSENNNNNSFTWTDEDRNSTKEEVFQFLKDQQIYNDMTYIEQTVATPQHRAAVWLAREDSANLKVPTNNDNAITMYHYLVRYIMAVNYYAWNGPTHWTNALNFLSPTNVCTWQGSVQVKGTQNITAGVFCDDPNSGIPNQLVLCSNHMKGSIPTENGLLTSLTHLDVSSNTLVTGTIPTNLCHLRQLQVLDVSYNTMSGNIPPCIGTTMSHLKWFYLAGNALEGTVPFQLGQMTQLQHFILEDNMFTGNPISIWNNMTELQMLYASHNIFTGIIDRNFFNTYNDLNILDVSHNQFTYSSIVNGDAFPHHLLTLFNLTLLDLSNNPLQGTFPKVLFPISAQNDALVYFSVSDTQMNGTFPDLHQLNALRHLDLSKNDFHGTIPSNYGANLTQLESLYLSENRRLTPGTIPSTLVDLNHIRDLSLRNINLQGTIPSYIGTNLTNLVFLDLGQNHFNNTVPSSLGNLQELQYLLLNGNSNLTGGWHQSTGNNHPDLKVLLIDGTGIKIESLSCSFPVDDADFKNTSSLTVYMDCVTPQFPLCSCCICCDMTDGFGCSKPLLANVDVSWSQSFDRTNYTLFENDGHG